MKKLAGYIILGLFFSGLFAVTVLERGLVNTLIVWGAAIASLAIMTLGIYLISDG